ncbi:hypothetical protein [Alkalicoccus chagannorensis]|uniref:hypothetical protein n=1 Tax=Alkalicoccus chagannorensis TaxID=427072 RepID=UPI00040262F0|nr:hypothetical protein [Alkalicoccus chagannorensis]
MTYVTYRMTKPTLPAAQPAVHVHTGAESLAVPADLAADFLGVSDVVGALYVPAETIAELKDEPGVVVEAQETAGEVAL